MDRHLCDIADVSETGTEFRVNPDGDIRYLVLFRRGDEIVGYDNVCPHQGRPLNLSPDQFLFTRDGWLMCPHHGASFDVETGTCVEGPCRGDRLKPAELEIRGQGVWLLD